MDYAGFFIVLVSVGAVIAGLLWLNHVFAKKRMKLTAKANAKLADAAWKRQTEYAESILQNFPAIMKKMIAELTEGVNAM